MSRDAETAPLPDKAALANVLSYLKTKNLKETAEALKKELGLASDAGLDSLPSGSSLQTSTVGQSGAEPEKYEESYMSQVPSSTASMAEVLLNKELAPDQSSSSSDDDDYDEEDDDHDEQEANSTMEISSRSPLSSRPLSLPVVQLQGTQAVSTTSDQEEEEDEEEEGDGGEEADVENDDDDTPRVTKTQFVFTTANSLPSRSPIAPLSSLDKGPSWLQMKSFPPPLVPSSNPPVLPGLVSSTSSSSPTLLQHKAALQQHLAVVTSPPAAQAETAYSSISTTTVGTSQLPINAPLFYHLAAPAAQPVGGVRQSVLTPILTFLPNAQSLVAGRQVGAAIPQPVILSPPAAAQALGIPLASSSSSAAAAQSLISGFTSAKVATNGVAHQQPKSLFEQSLGLAQSHVLSTEPTTGQQTLKSPMLDTVTSTARNTSPPRTLASIPLSEMTPQYSELKAFAEEFKNKRIRLGFTQGAVGQSLADKGYSNFAQSTISRFEQMQLSPTNAAAIKLVLEKWLQETENPEAAHSPSSSSPMMASRKRKRRAVFTPQTKTTLETYFKQNPRPNRHIIESVAHELDLLPEEVRVWFCNKRQKEKQGTGCGSGGGSGVPMAAYKYPYERDSSVSLSSSGANSPSSLYDSSLCPKRCTPSPPRTTTPFTIDELSKSSSTSTKTISSPVCIANPFATSPQGLVMALTTPKISFTTQPTIPGRVVMPQLQVSQTTA